MDVISRRLLFRIGTVGFYLELSELVEIREQIADLIDCRQVDQQLSVVGALTFRKTLIPVVDLSSRLSISSVSPDIVLVLNSLDGNWGLLVDRVEGFYSATEMIDRSVPDLLQEGGWRCFDLISTYEGHPFLKLNLSACYSGTGR